MFVAVRDFERRKNWDDRLEDRNTLRVIKYFDKEYVPSITFAKF